MPALTPQELADALYCRGERAINPERVLKAVRHLTSREDYEATLAALPEGVRPTFIAELRALADRNTAVRAQVDGWL